MRKFLCLAVVVFWSVTTFATPAEDYLKLLKSQIDACESQIPAMTQAADEDVHHIAARIERIAPDLLQQLMAAAHLARVAHEVLQEPEFRVGHWHDLTAGRHFVGIALEDEPRRLQTRRRRRTSPAEETPDPRQQLLQLKWLRHVVVRAAVQP